MQLQFGDQPFLVKQPHSPRGPHVAKHPNLARHPHLARQPHLIRRLHLSKVYNFVWQPQNGKQSKLVRLSCLVRQPPLRGRLILWGSLMLGRKLSGSIFILAMLHSAVITGVLHPWYMVPEACLRRLHLFPCLAERSIFAALGCFTQSRVSTIGGNIFAKLSPSLFSSWLALI